MIYSKAARKIIKNRSHAVLAQISESGRVKKSVFYVVWCLFMFGGVFLKVWHVFGMRDWGLIIRNNWGLNITNDSFILANIVFIM